jgi:hypothetical protein
MDFDDMFGDLDALVDRYKNRVIIPGFYTGDGYGKTLQEGYLSMVMAPKPFEEDDGVYADKVFYLEPPEEFVTWSGAERVAWMKQKVMEYMEPGKAISFGYLNGKRKRDGAIRYGLFGVTAPHPVSGDE